MPVRWGYNPVMKKKGDKRKARRFVQRMREKGQGVHWPPVRRSGRPEQPKDLSMDELWKKIGA